MCLNSKNMVSHPDFCCGGQRRVAGRFHELSFLLLGLRTHQCVELGGQVPSQKSLLRVDIQEHGEGFGVKTRFQNLKKSTTF